jgi:hypothetical protein
MTLRRPARTLPACNLSPGDVPAGFVPGVPSRRMGTGAAAESRGPWWPPGAEISRRQLRPWRRPGRQADGSQREIVIGGDMVDLIDRTLIVSSGQSSSTTN